MRWNKHHGACPAMPAKPRRVLIKALPIFGAERLEARCLLSVTLTTSTTLLATNNPDDLQATPIADPVFLGSPGISGSSTPYGLTPNQIRGAYGMGSYTGGNLSNGISFEGIAGDGRGQTIAIIDAYDDPYAASDLNAFSSYFGLPQFNGAGEPTFEKLNQSGNTSPLPSTDPAGKNNQNGTWEEEESLDIEWAHVMAPMANIILFEASTSSNTNLYAAVQTATKTSGVVVVSMSWSGNDTSSTESSYDSYFTTPSGHLGGSATLGGTELAGNITFVASAGDYGPYYPGTSTIKPQYPAASPNVVAAGGTTLTVTGSNPTYTWASETGWGNGTSTGTSGGGGGGISVGESQPAYQNGVVGNYSTTKRTYPDISLDANPNTGVPIYDSWDFGNSTPWIGGYEGGTSLASPMFAGLVAVADEGRAIAGKGSLDGHNQTLPTLYSLPSTDFHDITSGSTGSSPTYVAAPGYNLVGGLGSAVGNLLVPALAGGSQLIFNQQPTGVMAGSTISPSITVDVEDAAGNIVTSDSSSVTLSIGSGPGTLSGTVTVTAVNGVATFGNISLHTAGSYTLTATDGSLASATSSSFTVTAAAAFKLAYAQQPTGSTVGAAISPAITVDIEDQYGNIVGNATSSVTLATASGPGTLGGSTTVAAVSGVGIFGNVSLPIAGNYTLLATDGTLGNATSSSFTVAKAATTTTVTSSGNSSIYGQSVTFTATITPASGSGENGTVQFQIDGGNVGSAMTLSGNTAAYTTSTLSTGSHSVVAVYSGDGNFTGSTSSAFAQNVSLTAWLSSTSAATWNITTQTLTVTGNATIIADPNDSGVEPLIYDSGNTSNLSVDTQVGDGGDGDATVHVGLISGNGTTTVSGTGLLVAGNFSQTALTNNGVVEIDGTGVIGQLTGSGNLTVGNGTSDNTVQLAAAATSDGFNNAQGSVTIGVGSTLDITDSILLLNYGNGSTPLAVVQAAVAYGAGVSGASGAYGSIMSSTANAGKAGKYTVGYADSTEVTSIPSGNVELMYTLSGDANLDGVVNFNDYSTLQNNYDKSGTDWSQGDFNHDGVVNFNDFSMLQNNYDQTVTSADAVTPASGDLSQSATATTPAAQSVAEPVYTLYTPAITNLFSSNQNISAADATSWLQQ